MFKELVTNIPVVVVSIIATVTGGTAVAKVAREMQTQNTVQARQVVELRDQTPTPTVTVIVTQTATAPIATPQPTQTNESFADVGAFTLATLATHNISGDCFVAYKGIVYNVSAHPSWQTCTHHGTQGGRDITSIFPHATSYFSTLPKVGTLQGGSTGTPGSSISRDSDDDNEEDEREEDEREDEDENEDEQEDENEVEDESEDD